MSPVTPFDLEILSEDRDYRVRVLSSPHPWPETQIPKRDVRRALESRFAGLATKLDGDDPFDPLPSRLDLAELGRWLFQTFFQGAVLEAWNGSLRRGRTRGVRLRLFLDAEARLSRLPWEALCGDRGFLALEGNVEIVRALRGGQEGRESRLRSPVSFVFLDGKGSAASPLETESEWREIETILKRKGAKPRFDPIHVPFTKAEFPSERIPPSVQIVHFSGHGEFQREISVGTTQHGTEEEYYLPEEWITDLSRLPNLRLVVLNCCLGARHSPKSAHTSLAASLVKAGIPASVAMQFPISDVAARAFSRGLYSALTEGKDTPDAVQQGRRAIRAAAANEWTSPVLYVREVPPIGWWEKILRWLGDHWQGTGFGLAALAAASVLMYHTKPLEERWWRALHESEGVVENRKGIEDPDHYGERWQCRSPLGSGLHLLLVPPGKFTMGLGQSGEGQAHTVTLTRPFCIGETEVKQKEWAALMGTVPSSEKGDDLPVTGVNWIQANEYLAELNRRNPELRCSLPSEAQYEYAAGAGKGYPFGHGSVSVYRRAFGNCGGAEGIRDGYDKLAPVKEFDPNDWGIYGMVGNASEWVQDWYAPYSATPVVDPVGPPEGTERVRRGGSYRHKPGNSLSTSREQSLPTAHEPHFGFRVVCAPLPRIPR